MTGPATAVVAEGLVGLGQTLGNALGARLTALCDRAGDPPTIAVAGRVSSGKSTLVNALVGRRVAPTDAGECTHLVSRFRYGRAEQVVVHTRDGGSERVPLDDRGRVPESVGIPIEEIDHLQVFLAVGRLRRLELVDTPGVSAGSAASDRAEGYLGFDAASRSEVARADAVIYLLTPTGRTDEGDDLAAFGAAGGGRADAAVGVLGKADLIAGGDVAAAADLAARLATQFAASVSCVVPMWTLVAETVACGRLRESDATAIAAIADLDPTSKFLLLQDAGLFVDHPAPVARLDRQRLQDLLSHSASRRSVELAEGGVRGAARLTKALDQISGRTELERSVDRLADRADVLRAARLIQDAERLGYEDWNTGQPVRDLVERLRADPRLHVLDELTALDALDAGTVTLPEQDAVQARAILMGHDSPSDPDAVIDRWRAIEVTAGDPSVQHLARTVGRSLAIRRRETP